jgi:hypothetical protein
LLSTLPLSAALLTSAPVGGSTTTLAGGGSCFSGPSAGVVSGFSLTATNDACYNYSGGWGLDSNGNWGMSLIGDNSGSTLFTIDLGGLFGAVGGFLNYAPGYGTPVITALAADGVTVLESYDLSVSAPISTPSGFDQGAFRGISRPTAEIAYLQFGGSYTALHDLTLVEGSTVPEPATTFLVLAGSALAFLGKRRLRG